MTPKTPRRFQGSGRFSKEQPKLSKVESIVVVEGNEGFQAYLVHANERDNSILSHKYKQSLYNLIDSRLGAYGWNL